MSESRKEELIENFADKEYRESYAEDYLNTTIATQLRVIREQRGLTQAQLADAVGTKQTAISRIENVNNVARNIGTLEAIAFELGCRLKVTFETFGSLIEESLHFSREALQRPSFEEDPVLLGIASASFLPVGTNAYIGPVALGPLAGVTLVPGYSNVGIVGLSAPVLMNSFQSVYEMPISGHVSAEMIRQGNMYSTPPIARKREEGVPQQQALAA